MIVNQYDFKTATITVICFFFESNGLLLSTQYIFKKSFFNVVQSNQITYSYLCSMFVFLQSNENTNDSSLFGLSNNNSIIMNDLFSKSQSQVELENF